MHAKHVAPSLTPKAWPLIAGWVNEALAKGQSNATSEQIRTSLETDFMQLWLAWDGTRAHGCCITELYDGARGKTCGLVAVAGLDFKRWRPLIATIKDWAVSEGCVRLEAAGRDGWQRYVRADGWRKVRVVIEMDLKEHGRKQPDTEDAKLVDDKPLGAGAGRSERSDPRNPVAIPG